MLSESGTLLGNGERGKVVLAQAKQPAFSRRGLRVGSALKLSFVEVCYLLEPLISSRDHRPSLF